MIPMFELLDLRMETTISEGAIPKLTISARESNSFPIADDTFNSLATKPSKK